ncbi:hypothetical protein Afil01_28450 [Actinorhabdospora filicis]|uniref:Trypsin-like peptidase n=1 Tax=Actinorhabdospora filicis TaxID=1785913 RepID=A0A9W6W9I9_9ACTN|nr:serine protease [Actinorhabdospora filicis]GLZ78038.1 hypothetical protein Afil01_28450 [Actinorhabdospora filicis]
MRDGIGPEHAVAHVLGPGARPVGLAFAAAGGRVMTCAHVVNTALGRPRRAPDEPDLRVALLFPLSADDAPRSARVLHWPEGPEWDAGRDLAVLALDEPIPGDVPELMLAPYVRHADIPVQLVGSAATSGMRHVRGHLVGSVAAHRWQINQENGEPYRAEPGFSGGPVWDRNTGVVLGVLRAASDEHMGAECVDFSSIDVTGMAERRTHSGVDTRVARLLDEATRLLPEYQAYAASDVDVVPYHHQALVDAAENVAHAEPARVPAFARAMTMTYDRVNSDSLLRMARVLAARHPERARALVAEAGRLRHGGTQQPSPETLAMMAVALAPGDSAYAGRLVAQAEARLSDRSFGSHDTPPMVLAHIARALAPMDPDRARSLGHRAQTLLQREDYDQEDWRATQLAELAAVLAEVDGPGAEELVLRAERLMGRTSRHGPFTNGYLFGMIRAVSSVDPACAERIVRRRPDGFHKTAALTIVARATAAGDPAYCLALAGEIEAMAETVFADARHTIVTAETARAIAAVDPDRAERLVDLLPPTHRTPLLTQIARSLREG